MFIAVDGVDGAGKTTLVRQLAEMFGPLDPVVTKEPTDISDWGRQLRTAAVQGRLPPDVELDYFRRDRIHHLEHLIKPSLKSGKIVITDRYVDSTLAFQAHTPTEADKLYEEMLPKILVPDVTFILKCSVDIGLDRIRRRNGGSAYSKFEDRNVLEKARAVYESRTDDHYELINAEGNEAETLRQALEAFERRFSNRTELLSLIRRPNSHNNRTRHVARAD